MALQNGYKLIVGIDYGTTSTGVTYTLAGNGHDYDIDCIKGWPSGEGSFKVPYRISYIEDHTPHLWGFQIWPGMRSYSWTKLLLDGTIDHNEFDDEALEAVAASGILKLPEGLDAVTVVRDFLHKIQECITPILARLLRSRDLNSLSVEYCFTVPATWSTDTQSLMIQAAREAGFAPRALDRISTVSEPEAAALAVLKHAAELHLKPQDGILICDCGGGTVDLTTYYITDVVPEVRFEQLTTAIGGKCGGTAVDSRFYNLLSTQLGSGFDDLAPSVVGPGSELMNQFEDIKAAFDGGEREHLLTLNVSAPRADPSFFNRRKHKITLRSQHLRELFNPVLARIVNLILTQVTATQKHLNRQIIKKVVLVGGFSRSPYLQDKLRRSLQEISDISVLVPPNPERAVAYGAVLKGLLGHSPATCKCHRHYGLASPRPLPSVQETDSSNIRQRLRSSVLWDPYWVVERGRSYSTGFSETVTITLYHWDDDLLVKPLSILECNLPIAPHGSGNPDVHQIDYVYCHLGGLDLSVFPHRRIAGRIVHQLDVQVQVSLAVPDRKICFVANVLGQELGRKEILMARE